MTVAEFFRCDDGLLAGFSLSGHTRFGESGSDIVCAAVSSAVYMTANALTDVLSLTPEIQCSDGFLRLVFTCKQQAQAGQQFIKGLELHLKSLEADYPNNVKVKYGGVRKCLK